MAGTQGGRRLGAGRKIGSVSRLPTIRAAFEQAFHVLQEDDDSKLDTWAKGNKTEFYKLSARLIPQEMTHSASAETLEALVNAAAGIRGKKD